jgi:hypothetical protein
MKKWEKGEQIMHPVTACDAILAGEVLFHNHKAQNTGWLQNWNLSQIRREVMVGRLFKAISTEDQK